MVRRRIAAALGIVAASAGSTSGCSTFSHACTAIGYSEGVDVDLSTALPLEGGGYQATVSVPSLDLSAMSSFAGNDADELVVRVATDLSSEPVTVDVRVVTERGDAAYEASTLATPELHQPNGPRCDGENHRITLHATEDGLTRAAAFEQARDEQGRASFVVHTACGVSIVTDGFSEFARAGGTLDDGASGPPPGWNVPDQRGWATIDGDTLTFQDERGHTEVFQRVPADQVTAPACG